MINGNSLILQFGKEPSYATLANPERQIKVASEGFKATYNKKDEGLLTSSRSGTGRKEVMSVKSEGSISTLARPDDTGLFLFGGLGVEEAVESVGTKAYKHTFHAIGTGENDKLPSLSAFVDRKVDVFTYNGLKIESFSFSASPEDYLKLDVNFVGKEEAYNGTMSKTLTPSPLKAFKFRHGKVKIAGAEIADITSIKFDYQNSLDSSTQTTGTGLYFLEPQVGGRNIKTDLEMLYTSDSEGIRKNYYKTDADVAIELTFTSDELIEDDIPYSLKITIPCNQCPDSTANFGSAETIKHTMSFEAFENGTDELITVELINGYANKY